MTRTALRPLLIAGFLLAAAPVPAQMPDGGAPAGLEALRQEALAEVNQTRRQHRLPELDFNAPLNAAAQAHAEDMLARRYHSHVSPEGEDPRDRHVAHGGNRWRTVAENLAMCEGCQDPLSRERVEAFHQGWMNSTEHRLNILAEGLDSFGFGIAAGGERVYAVQMFSGAGAPGGWQPGQTGQAPEALSAEEQEKAALAAINRTRYRDNLPPLEPSGALRTVAERALASGSGDTLIDPAADLYGFLVGEPAEWPALNALAAACGGCGTVPTGADVERFAQRWLDTPEHRRALLSAEAGHLGFAMSADGQGRKTAVAVIGRHR